MKAGILEEQEISLGQTRKLVLRIRPSARKALGIAADGTVHRESIAHEYWKRYYAQKFKKLGYEVQLEAPRKNGRVDVLATNGTESVGIEIETGASDVVNNVKSGLASGFDRVVVVATTEKAFERAKGALTRAGLLLPMC